MNNVGFFHFKGKFKDLKKYGFGYNNGSFTGKVYLLKKDFQSKPYNSGLCVYVAGRELVDWNIPFMHNYVIHVFLKDHKDKLKTLSDQGIIYEITDNGVLFGNDVDQRKGGSIDIDHLKLIQRLIDEEQLEWKEVFNNA